MICKAKELNIILVVNIDGKDRQFRIPANAIRNILNQEENLGKEIININIVYKNDIIEVPSPRAELEKAIVVVNQEPIVPSYLRKYLVDITWALASRQKAKMVGREYEIEKAWSILARDSRANAILVGPAGVGKNEIVIEMARRIAKEEAPKEFLGTRIIKFRPTKLMKVDKKFIYKRLLSDIENFVANSTEEIILYVENFIYMKYSQDFIYFLYSMIKEWNVRIIATSEEEEYEEYFLDDFEIAKYLNRVDVEAPELKDIYPMVKSDVELLKNKYGIEISEEMVKFIIYTSSLCEIKSSSPGNIISVFKWAFSNAKRKGKKQVEKEDVLACYNTDLQLFEKADPEEKKRIAYHEIGHYIMHRLCKNVKNEEIAFVSILPMMDFLGVNWTYAVKGKQLNYSRKAYEDLIKIYLGGRAAEEMFSGEYGDGASSDLEIANSLAEAIIMNYGLSNKEKQINRNYTYSGYYLKDYLFSDTLREEFNEEIKSIIDSAYEEVKKAVEDNETLISALVHNLLEHEILTGEDLERICNNFEAYVEKLKKSVRRKAKKVKENN